MADQLQVASLDWAIAHLNRFGDSDLLPVPFEYEAIKADWLTVRQALEGTDLSTVAARSAQHFMVPKPEGSFRVGTRLDPIDAVLFTAAVYECAEKIEAARAPKGQHIACSYRIDVDAKGKLFTADNGLADWNRKSDLAAGVLVWEEGFVVTADIADFYSQLSHHAVNRALVQAGVTPERAESIERMLMNWTALQSRGLPVGPQASILLAEICLNDVDQALTTKGYEHTRYVDDFRIFCATRATAERAMHDLSECLYQMHRLSLQPAKSRILEAAEYFEIRNDPDFLERQVKAERIAQLARSAYAMGPDAQEEDDDNDDEEGIKGTAEALLELFVTCVSEQPLHLGLARHVFRRAVQVRSRILLKPTLENLEALVPVFRDMVNYIARRNLVAERPAIAAALVEFSRSSPRANLPYVQEWILFSLATYFAKHAPEQIRALANNADRALGLRPRALVARAMNDDAWVRQHKVDWQNYGPWDRRAIIHAGSSLPAGERGFWKKYVLGAGDLLEQAVAKHALQ